MDAPEQSQAAPVNLTRALVTGKIPNAKANAPKGNRPGKMTAPRKAHARRLKKRGLISDRAAAQNGL